MKDQANILKYSLRSFFVLLFSLAVFASACKKENDEINEMEIRKVAWDHLDESQRSTVTTKWEEARVEKQTKDRPKDVAVIFNTTDDAALGPIYIYVSIKEKKVTFVGLRY